MATTTQAERTRPKTPLSTDPDPVPIGRLRRARLIRRMMIAALVLFVLAGLAGVFGYRTGEVSASGAGYSMRLSYPSVGRPGMPIQWILHLHRDGGLPATVTIATSIGYIDLLDMNGTEPAPTSETTTAGRVLWTFSAPKADDMTILVDAFISTNAHRGASAVTSVIEGGAPVVQVDYHTRVAP
jgi:hypothetical protein